MVDLHHHLLPGLDDGPGELETSVAMARMAAADGITRVVATPHASHHWRFSPEAIAERMAALRGALERESIALELGSGCDFHLSFDNIQDALANPRKYTLNGSDYLLVELPDFSLPAQLTETFYELRMAGMTPILTHPERNPTLQRDEVRLAEWLRQGMLVQITTSSLLGEMGKQAEAMAHRLLTRRWVHFLATDAHNLTTRPPRMRAARELAARKYGEAYATLLCEQNPLAVWEGRPLGEQPTPRKLFDDPQEDDQDEELPWWRRWLRRS